MRPNHKRLVAVLVMFVFVSALAIFISTLLGKAYLGLLKSGISTKDKPKPPKATAVVSGGRSESIVLPPVPVFYLQGGVYSDLESARLAAEEFLNQGLDPYITGVAPYRLYVGFFGSREEAYKLKDFLSQKEISTFVQTSVLNANALVFSADKGDGVKKWAPCLEKASLWLKTIGEGGSFGSFELANRQDTERVLISSVPQLEAIVTEMHYASGNGNDPAGAGLADAAELVRRTMQSLQQDWNQNNYNLVCKALIEFSQAYSACWQVLAGAGKT